MLMIIIVFKKRLPVPSNPQPGQVAINQIPALFSRTRLQIRRFRGQGVNNANGRGPQKKEEVAGMYWNGLDFRLGKSSVQTDPPPKFAIVLSVGNPGLEFG